MRGRPRPEPVLGFPQGARPGRVNSLELATLTNSGGLWAVGVVSLCLVPGPGLIQGRGATLAHESWRRRGGLHKDAFLAQPSAVSETRSALGGAISPWGCESPPTKCQTIQQKKIR